MSDDVSNAVLKLLSDTLAATESRKSTLSQLQLYERIKRQLAYLEALFSGQSVDRKLLHEIDVGLIGLREFDDVDPVYSKLLKRIQYAASQKAAGLKIDVTKFA